MAHKFFAKTITTCLIGGKEYEYDLCANDKSDYDDVKQKKYLGEGTIYKVNGKVQNGNDRVLHFWTKTAKTQ